MTKESKIILVTGGAGNIGTNLCNELPSVGTASILLSRKNWRATFKSADLHSGSLTFFNNFIDHLRNETDFYDLIKHKNRKSESRIIKLKSYQKRLSPSCQPLRGFDHLKKMFIGPSILISYPVLFFADFYKSNFFKKFQKLWPKIVTFSA